MSAPLSPDELARFTHIIDGILATADLETISRKKVRQGLETSLGGRDLSDQKDAIKRLIEARFDAVSGANVNDASASSVPDPSPNKRHAPNGVSDSAETDPSASPEPAKKKAKRSTPSEDADARLAAALQAQENSLARGRSTRGGGDRTKVVKKKKAPRKKSAKKVGEDDDSDVDGSADSAPKRKAGGGFQKPFNLSATLSELCGETQVVKKLWEHIKANDLQDPKDKRQIRCDDKMQAVFKQARVDMFRMNKEIGHHLYPRADGDDTLKNPAAQDLAAAAARAHAAQEAGTDGQLQRPINEAAAATANGAADDADDAETPAPFVIFTDDAEKRFEDYSDRDITTTDTNIGIKYTNEDIVGDTVLLLRYNCPDPSCDFAGLGWPDLHRHVKSVHRKRMCDLCTRNKKVFTHEHELFSDKELERHMRHGDDKPGAADQTGFKGHPLCGFCGERFYDDDKLYEHCRMKHERCFLCDRRDSRKPHYYQDYNALEQHFKKDHYLCSNAECLEKKFVVFESELDLQAHQLSEHGGKTAGRDARTVDMSAFDLRQSYQPERRGGAGGGRAQRDSDRGGRGRGGRTGGGRGRDPNEDMVPPTSAQPLRRDEIAFQRQMAIHSAQSVSNRTFGGQLTAPTPAQAATSLSSSRQSASTPRSATPNAGQSSAAVEAIGSLSISDTSNMTPDERASLVRHSAAVERASNLLGNDTNKVAQFRNHISSYRKGGLTAPQLIDAFFTLFADVSSNALGTLVREVADLFEDKSKADNLRKAWQDWRAINEDYPSLPGLSGMHGATSSSSGWANASSSNPAVPNAAPSQKHSTRVLKLKNSTRLGGPAPVAAAQRGPPGWTAPPTNIRTPVSSAFPSLAATTGGSSSSGSAASRPSWIASASQPSSSSSASRPLRTATGSRGATGGEAFPALPAAPKPTTTIFGYGTGRGVRRDYGYADSGFQWGGGSGGSGSGAATPPTAADEDADDAAGGKGGKKGGKKGKKVLVQWG
ncbi:proline transporter [Purpureocillium lavendulum]|uniref:Proline transporter n=1 Tax=Purpureocillium lavendulum TaxID=1247861 RepID=A0AB34G189_9HYPO|nr:proline transporter [Purpureocillium lavendulum]